LADLSWVCDQVRPKITPSPKLKADVLAKAEEIRARVESECVEAQLPAEVRIEGSVAKDTWIRDHADVDVFMRVSPELTKQQLRDVCLPIAKRALRPNSTTERFAEHPYLEASVTLTRRESLRVNVVPCYNVERGQWLSATDRTPYHTEYILAHLTIPQRAEARLLKAFMRGIGTYGADIKTGGFSGMLCETLIASQNDFEALVKKFGAWQETRYIDLENHFHGRGEEVHRLFREPLIVIDPVDKGRNLAAAVREEQLWTFVAAARQLIAKPSTRYFQEPTIRPITAATYRRLVRQRGSTVLAVVLGRMDVVVDVLWSQLYKTERALVNLLEANDFQVLRSAAWSDEESLNVILLELAEADLPESKKHAGPPIARAAESASFLSKHMRSKSTIAGPWVEGDRWVVERKREFTSSTQLLEKELRDGGKKIGVPSEPARSFQKRVEIISGQSIARLIASNPEFSKAMKLFLSGRPPWLE